MRFEGRAAVVTGAGRGLGEAMARRFAAEGARVVVADLDAAAAEGVAAAIRELGGVAEALRIDVAKAEDTGRLAAFAVERFGRLDIHVNNAGVASSTLFLDATEAEFRRTLDVNLVGAFLCAQAAAREMVARGWGRIVNVTSISGQRGGVGRAAYGASKAGLELLTRVMAVELAARGVTVNAVAPGPVATALADAAHDAPTREAYRYLVPQRRFGAPEEVAAAVAFLASEEASFVTGHTLNVDGGFGAAGLMFRKAGLETPEPPPA